MLLFTWVVLFFFFFCSLTIALLPRRFSNKFFQCLQSLPPASTRSLQLPFVLLGDHMSIVTRVTPQLLSLLLKSVRAYRIYLEKWTNIGNLEFIVFKVIEDFSPWESKGIKVSRPKIGIQLTVIRDNVAIVMT